MGISTDKTELFRKLPSVDELLRRPEIMSLSQREGQDVVTAAARSVVESMREAIAHGTLNPAAIDIALASITEVIERQVGHTLSHSLRPVINATGVVLHTNLGRAPLSESALAHV